MSGTPARGPTPRHWVSLLGLPLLLAWLFTLSPLHPRLEAWLQDSAQRLLATEHHDGQTVVIDIDNDSLLALRPYLGPWPYSRQVYALLLDYLGEMQVRTVFLDILFLDPRPGDEALRATLQHSPHALLAASALHQPAEDGEGDWLPALAWARADATLPALDWPAAALPTPLLSAAQAPPRIGIVSFRYDTDGLLRRVPLLHRIGEHYLPSAILGALYPDTTPPPLALEGRTLRIGDRRWHVAPDGSLGLVYPANPTPFATLSFTELVLAALGAPGHAIEPDHLRGKTLFIGTTALFADHVNTPLGVLHGIKLLAMAYTTLQAGRYLHPDSPLLAAALAGLALLPALATLLHAHQRGRAPAPAAVLAGSLVLLLGLHALYFGLLALHRPVWLVPAFIALLTSTLLASAQAQRLQVRRETAAARAALQAARHQAETQRQAMAMVSHELKSPLATIDLSLQNLSRQSDLPPKAIERHHKIRRASRRLLALIDEHLAEDRLQRPDAAPGRQHFDLFALLDEIVRAAERPHLRIVRSDEGPLVLAGERSLLRIALANLVDNAIKYAPEHSPIEIVVSGHDAWVRLTVIDQGCGIDPADLPHIFEPYYRGRGLRQPGSGLGLALVRRIVAQHEGSVQAHSTPGQGTRFDVCLPLPGHPGRPAGALS